MKKVTFDLDIYSYQIDCAGQVHNAVYVNWMEIGRLKMLDAVGLPMTSLISQGSYPALAQTTIAYKTPLFLNDRVWVEMQYGTVKEKMQDFSTRECGIQALD
jgi:acyl-CoA thioester hydrolase